MSPALSPSPIHPPFSKKINTPFLNKNWDRGVIRSHSRLDCNNTKRKKTGDGAGVYLVLFLGPWPLALNG